TLRTRSIQMKIDDQRKVIAGSLGKLVPHDTRGANFNGPAIKRLVERTYRQPSRKAAKARRGMGNLLPAGGQKARFIQAVPPVVVVASNQQRNICEVAHQAMFEQVANLPIALALDQAQ